MDRVGGAEAAAGSEAVVVIGCGAIGLPFAVALAQRGCSVLGYDRDPARVAGLSDGTSIPDEPALAAALAGALDAGRLRFATALTAAIERRSFVLAVPTGWDAARGLEREPLDAAVDAVAAVARPGDALFLRSTVPVGTARALARRLAAAGLDLAVAAIPDRTAEGRNFAEQFDLPHLVGGLGAAAGARAASLVARLGPVVELGAPEAAEAAKLFCNMARDVMFGLANEIAEMCETLGLDGHAILAAAAAGYPRFSVPRPGPVGGPCLSKDTMLLAASLPEGRPTIGRAARAVNLRLLDRVAAVIGDHLRQAARAQPRVALLGIAFKGRPAVADWRGSAALAVAGRLRAAWPGIELAAWDAEIDAATLGRLGLAAAPDPAGAARGADVVLLANDHPALAVLDLAGLARLCRQPVLLYQLCGRPAAAPVLAAGQRLAFLGDGTAARGSRRDEAASAAALEIGR